jgi:hydrogenase expression/formation protein HypE
MCEVARKTISIVDESLVEIAVTGSLPTGKVSKDVLKRLVFTCLGVPSGRVLKGPHVGEDSAVLDMGDRFLVAKANPITGAESRIGWLAVHINANDVAVRGAEPRWYMSVVLLPEGADESLLETIMREQHEACCELGVCVMGGHTEVTPGLMRPIVSGFMLGEAEKGGIVTSGGAKAGDEIILTRGAGIEGTGILAVDLSDRLAGKVDETTLKRAMNMLRQVSVVPEALAASKVKGVHSIHTPTEGGVLNGLLEASEASKLGFKVYEEGILVAPETQAICGVLGVDPLRLLSSGALLITVDPSKTETVLSTLKNVGVEAQVIGEMMKGSEHIIVGPDGLKISVDSVDQDELYRVLGQS